MIDNIPELISASYALTWQDPFRPSWLKELTLNDEPYYRFLYYLLWNTRPEIAIELGVYKGLSLAHMQSGCRGSLVLGIDNELVDTSFALGPLDNQIIKSDSVKYLKKYDGPPIGVLHIDTEHTPEQVTNELEAALPHMSSPSVICIDDITIDDDMKTWWENLDMNKIAYPDLHTTGYGVIIV